MSGYFFISCLFLFHCIFQSLQVTCLSTFMKFSCLLQAIKDSEVTSLYHLQQTLSEIVAFIEKTFVAIHFWSCINSFIDFPAKCFNHLHQMGCFLLFETQKFKQLIVVHFSNARTVKVECVMIQRKLRSLLEEIQIFEDSTQGGSYTARTVWNLFFAVLKQMCYLEFFVLCSVTLQESCLEFVEKFRESFEALLVLEDEICRALIEYLQTYIFLVGDLEENFGECPHEEPYSVAQLYCRQHRAIEAVFSICLQQRANFQLNFLPIFVILLEDDIAGEPRLQEETQINHSLPQSWLRQAIFVGFHLIQIKLLVVVRECSH